MPTETFLNLSEEKKEKILVAAKEEFARVPFNETSIKNIVENAGIARGSFYQYFETKEDLLEYTVNSKIRDLDEKIRIAMKETNGDVFELFIQMYDFMMNQCFENTDQKFYQNILKNLKEDQGMMFGKIYEAMHRKENGPIEEYIGLIDKDKLKISKEDDIEVIFNILYAITRRALITALRHKSKEEAKKEYLREITYIKYGIIKQEN